MSRLEFSPTVGGIARSVILTLVLLKRTVGTRPGTLDDGRSLQIPGASLVEHELAPSVRMVQQESQALPDEDGEAKAQSKETEGSKGFQQLVKTAKSSEENTSAQELPNENLTAEERVRAEYAPRGGWSVAFPHWGNMTWEQRWQSIEKYRQDAAEMVKSQGNYTSIGNGTCSRKDVTLGLSLSFEECKQMCAQDDTCTCFSFKNESGRCGLYFNLVPGRAYLSQRTIGFECFMKPEAAREVVAYVDDCPPYAPDCGSRGKPGANLSDLCWSPCAEWIRPKSKANPWWCTTTQDPNGPWGWCTQMDFHKTGNLVENATLEHDEPPPLTEQQIALLLEPVDKAVAWFAKIVPISVQHTIVPICFLLFVATVFIVHKKKRQPVLGTASILCCLVFPVGGLLAICGFPIDENPFYGDDADIGDNVIGEHYGDVNPDHQDQSQRTAGARAAP